MIVNKSAELAKLMQVSAPCIVRFRERGMPFKRASLNRYTYDLDKCMGWLASQGQRQLEHVKKALKEIDKNG